MAAQAQFKHAAWRPEPVGTAEHRTRGGVDGEAHRLVHRGRVALRQTKGPRLIDRQRAGRHRHHQLDLRRVGIAAHGAGVLSAVACTADVIGALRRAVLRRALPRAGDGAGRSQS